MASSVQARALRYAGYAGPDKTPGPLCVGRGVMGPPPGGLMVLRGARLRGPPEGLPGEGGTLCVVCVPSGACGKRP